jgi:hypothetical protein
MNPQITSITERPAMDSSGKMGTNVLVTFKVGTHGPFTIEIPKPQFTAAEANKRVAEFAAHVAGVAGQAK